METVTLHNGVRVPVLGLGTFMISPEDAETAVYAALRLGYRMIDTANAYMNEEAVGRALNRAMEEGLVRREEVFVSTKIWPTLYEQEDAVERTLERLGLSYVDLLFLHQPAGNYRAGYRMLEQALRDGRTRSLGISNFYGNKLEQLLEAAQIPPHVLQLEVHPYCTQAAAMERLSQYGTRLMGWYPLGHGDPGLLHEPVFVRLADKYRRSCAQIILRWHTQKGFITIPGSKNPDHIRDNGAIFDFSLTPAEMEEIAGLDGTRKYYQADDAAEEKYARMHLPFEK